MSFPRYPNYKDSGVEWLGEVPEHWARTRIKHVAKAGKRTFVDGDWIETPYISTEGVRLLQCGNVGTGIFEEQGFRFVSHETFRDLDCTEVEPNDVLICRLQSSRTILAGRACLAPDLGVKMITSVDNCILKSSSEFDPRYIVYQLTTSGYLSFIEVIARGGTRDRISRSMLGDVEIAAPPIDEQTSIAAFLDQETAKIDDLVAEQRRLIELLKEKRQAVISHAVTKGLNPNVTMRPSGIEWLGDIPEHWEVTILKRLVDLRRPITYGIVQPGEPEPQGRFMIRGGDYSNGWCSPDEVFRVSDAIEIPYARSRMKAGDLIITIVGAGVGNVGITPEWLNGANITQTSARIALDPDKAIAEFVCLALQGIIGQRNLDLNVYGAAQPRLNIAHVDTYLMTVPPLDEQSEIAKFVTSTVDRFRFLICEAERAIELLQERRTALISAAVTGKIDVREIETV